MKRALTLVTALLALSLPACQGAPQYAGYKAKPDNEVNLGWGRSIRLGAETKGTLRGLQTSNGTKIDELVLEQSPAQTMAGGWVPVMDAYGRQQVNFVPILKQYGDNAVNITNAVFSGINEIAKTAMPGVLAAVQGHYTVRQAEAQAPSLRTELINAIAGGLISLPQAQQIMAQLPSIVETEVLANPVVRARLEQEKTAITDALSKE